MKLHRLELVGFGPFRDPQQVDFDAFDDDGIFLIAGRTGAGKSSILDAVCFALYGSAPRYDGVEKRLRSDHCAPGDPTRVSVEFSVGSTRWRVTRSPEYERPKARGVGMTPVAHSAELSELVDGEWIGRAAKPREVGLLLDEIVGLSQQQFLQVILLAQNRFAQFLLAKNDERRALLRTLFGTRSYGEYQKALEQRRRDAEQRLVRGGDSLRVLLDEFDRDAAANGLDADEHSDESAAASSSSEPTDPAGRVDSASRIAAAERTVGRAAYRAEARRFERETAQATHVAAAATLTRVTAVHEKLRERDQVRTTRLALEERSAEIARERHRVSRAWNAETLRAPIDAARRAAAEAEAAATAAATARVEWRTRGGEADADASALRALVDVLTGELSLWASAAEQERSLAGLERERDDRRDVVARLEATLAGIDAARAAVPMRLADLDARLEPLAGAESRRESARVALEAVEARLAAAREAERHEQTVREAETAHAVRTRELEEAAAAVTALLRRRLAGYAGELAAELVDGEPCAVCGATAHPAPAAHGDEPVTDSALDEAERVRDVAATAAKSAAERARTAREVHAATVARAGGESVAVLEESVVAARESCAEAVSAVAVRERLLAEREQLVASDAAAAQERAEVDDRLSPAREAHTVAVERLAAAERIVGAARGDFTTVAERIAEAESRRNAAAALEQAQRESDARADAARRADEDRDALIVASDFADAAEATAALLSAADRAAADTRLQAYDVALAGARERELELELALAGESGDAADVDEARRVGEEAEAAWTAAVAADLAATQTVDRLRALQRQAIVAHSASAELRAEHDLVAGLANAVSGRNASRMDLETFVLAAELEEIVEAANLRLDDMSSGRYRLRHTDALATRNTASGLGLEILDAYTGQARPPQSLSGGETFLASLALALGLAQVVTDRAGGLRLDTLFIDEGFGSLDADTLRLAMDTLDELRQGGRTVGVISHVEAMQEELAAARLTVEASPHGPSVIRQDQRVPSPLGRRP